MGSNGAGAMDRGRANRVRVLATVASILGPVLVLGASAAILLDVLEKPEDVRRHVRGDFACEGADIVVTGSSRARTDIDLNGLTLALAPPPRRAVAATVHGSNAPVWYAVLKNGVFARGCAPELVIVYDIADKLFAADVLPDERVRLLAPYLTGDDPVIERRIFGRKGRGVWQRTRERVAASRKKWLNTLTAWATGLMFVPHPGERRVDVGRRVLDRTFDRVFGLGKLNREEPSMKEQVLPGGAPPVVQRSVLATRPEETFLADIIALARGHGAEVVVARAPSPPSRQGAEEAGEALVRACAALVEREGGHYVDLRSPDVSDAWYADVRHMNALGRTRITKALGARIRALGLVTGGRPPEGRGAAPGGGPRGTASLDLSAVLPTVEGPSPLLGPTPPVEPAGRGTGAFRVPELREVADDACERHEVLACCSPLRVAENGHPLPFPNATADEVTRLGRGRYVHLGDRVLFSSLDGTDPIRNGRRYTLGMEPGQRCGGTWIFPGQTLRFSTSTATGHPRGAWSRLEVWARDFSGDGTSNGIRVKLECDDTEWLDTQVLAARMSSAPASLPIVPGGHPTCHHLVLEVGASGSDGPFLLTWARLEE